MEIYFDFELDENMVQPADPGHIMFQTIKKFARSCYGVLEDQIDSTRPNMQAPAAIIIRSVVGGIDLIPFNISNHLMKKVEACFTPSDFDYLTDLLSRIRNQE